MITEITKAQLLCLQLGRLKDDGHVRAQQVSLAKMNNVQIALDSARLARDVLGAAGIVDGAPGDPPHDNLETVNTYEGTHDIHHAHHRPRHHGLDAFRDVEYEHRTGSTALEGLHASADADDDQDVREVTRRDLPVAGFDVLEAANGPSPACTSSGTAPTPWCSTLMMPRLGGVEALQRIHASTRASGVSCHRRHRSRAPATSDRGGAAGVFTKPVTCGDAGAALTGPRRRRPRRRRPPRRPSRPSARRGRVLVVADNPRCARCSRTC